MLTDGRGGKLGTLSGLPCLGNRYAQPVHGDTSWGGPDDLPRLRRAV
jgi:hypothetical protein